MSHGPHHAPQRRFLTIILPANGVIMPWKTRSMRESILNSGVKCGILIRECEIIWDELDDWSLPLDVGEVGIVINQH